MNTGTIIKLIAFWAASVALTAVIVDRRSQVEPVPTPTVTVTVTPIPTQSEEPSPDPSTVPSESQGTDAVIMPGDGVTYLAVYASDQEIFAISCTGDIFLNEKLIGHDATLGHALCAGEQ
jgi:hypothetical protein